MRHPTLALAEGSSVAGKGAIGAGPRGGYAGAGQSTDTAGLLVDGNMQFPAMGNPSAPDGNPCGTEADHGDSGLLRFAGPTAAPIQSSPVQSSPSLPSASGSEPAGRESPPRTRSEISVH